MGVYLLPIWPNLDKRRKRVCFSKYLILCYIFGLYIAYGGMVLKTRKNAQKKQLLLVVVNSCGVKGVVIAVHAFTSGLMETFEASR